MTRRKTWLVALASFALMAAAAALLQRVHSGQRLGQPGLRLAAVPLVGEDGETVATNSIALPEQILDFRSELLPVTRTELDWLPRDTTFGRRLYTSVQDGFQTQVSGVLMGTDRTSIHKPEFCLPSQGFKILRSSPRQIIIDSPHRYSLPVMRLDALRERRLPDGSVVRLGAVYVYWFLSDTRLSNDHLERMWWLALDLVRTGELQRWAYMGCLGACPPGAEDRVYARLERLIQNLVPEFQTTTGPLISSHATPPPGVDSHEGTGAPTSSQAPSASLPTEPRQDSSAMIHNQVPVEAPSTQPAG